MHVAQAPEGVAIGHGFAYVADSAGNVIRAVGLAQTIATRRLETVVAGTGAAGSAGDGGPATSALLNHPEGLAVDAAGNLFIADTGNNRIRRATVAGTITTVAGNGVFGYSGDGGPATAAHLANPTAVAVDAAGDLLIADNDNDVIRESLPTAPSPPSQGADLPATRVTAAQPRPRR